MKIKIENIGSIKLIPENDSDSAILQHWDDKYLLIRNTYFGEREEGEENDKCSMGELQTVKEIKNSNSYCMHPNGQCTFPNNDHKNHPKG